MKLDWNGHDYILTLSQGELNFIMDCLLIAVTHVSDAEYEIVIGKRKEAADHDISELAEQRHRTYTRRVRDELENSGAISVVLGSMGDLSVLTEDEITARITDAAARLGSAIEDGNRPQVILEREKIAALFGELNRRKADFRNSLRAMLDAADPGVQLTAAIYSLKTNSDQAVRILDALAVSRYARIAYEAELALKNWRERNTEYFERDLRVE